MKKKYLNGLKLNSNILRGLLFGVLLLALLSLSSFCFANTDEDNIINILNNRDSYLRSKISSSFIGKDYAIIKDGSRFYQLYVDSQELGKTINGSTITFCFVGGGYRITLDLYGTPSVDSFSAGRTDWTSYNALIFAKNIDNIPQTVALDNAFFMEPPPEPEPEIFNGVIESYDDGIVPVGTITPDAVNLKYHYDINTTYPGPNIHGKIYVYLEELTPGEAVQQTPYSVNNPTEENGFIRLSTSSSNYPAKYNVKFRDLLSYMKNGYIYRLQIGFVQSNVSGDSNSLGNVVYTDICTSEFFSKDSWYSDKILVKNIYKLVGDNTSYSGEDGVVILESGESGDKVTQGIFDIQNSIVDLNKNITGTIESTILGTPNESGDRQGGLVGNLLEGLWSGFIHLFVPDSEEFNNWLIETEMKLSSRGGFLLYSHNFWLSIINLLNNSESSDFIITLPEFSLPVLDHSVIWEEQTLNLNDYFEQNQVLQTFYNTYLVLISGLSIFVFCKYLWSLWDSIISGTGSVQISTDDNLEIDGWSGSPGGVQPHFKRVNTRHIKFK